MLDCLKTTSKINKLPPKTSICAFESSGHLKKIVDEITNLSNMIQQPRSPLF